MNVLLRYLMGWLARLMWQRIRGRSPLPPIRLPAKQPSPISAVAPWQALIAAWVLHKLWTQFGQQAKQQAQQQVKQQAKHQVKQRVKNVGRSASKRFDAWLYAPPRHAAANASAQPAKPAVPSAPTVTTPAHETQHLPDNNYA